MVNAVEDALGRASAEQKIKNQQVIEEARSNIKLVSMQQMEDISPSGADSIARNAQAIEEAKRAIPFETMQDVDEISTPLPTPPSGISNSAVIQIDPATESRIEAIEQNGGNNYLNQNAVDRALERQPANDDHQWEPQKQAIER